jgi:adenosylcobyric acid synthase
LKGFIINKFHGDVKLFDEGLAYLARSTDLANLGVVPHFGGAAKLPAEDTVILDQNIANSSNKTIICVLQLPRIANFDDFDPLRLEPDVSLLFIKPGQAIPGNAALVIIPGSKSTIADLRALCRMGWDIDLKAHHRRGGRILGLCGGYQMLGKMIHDPHGFEGEAESVAGLGFLDIETALEPHKTLRQTTALHCATGTEISGYEIHLGQTSGADCARPVIKINARADGAASADGLVEGTYLHGFFGSDKFRSAYLHGLGATTSSLAYDQAIEATLDDLANHLETNLNITRLIELCQ